MGYRDTSEALGDRSQALRHRLAELDAEAPSSVRGLPPPVAARLAELRREAELPAGPAPGAAAVQRAEEAVLAYETALDEALGLHAQLQKSVGGVIPDGRTVGRWAGFAATALVGLTGAVYELGLGDFMLRAFGAEVAIARPQLTAGQVFLDVALEAQRPRDTAPEAPLDDDFFRLIVESRDPEAPPTATD